MQIFTDDCFVYNKAKLVNIPRLNRQEVQPNLVYSQIDFNIKKYIFFFFLFIFFLAVFLKIMWDRRQKKSILFGCDGGESEWQ